VKEVDVGAQSVFDVVTSGVVRDHLAGTGVEVVREEQCGLFASQAGAVRTVGDEALFGQDVQTGKQSYGLVEIEVVDVAAAFLVQQLQRQQTEQCGVGRDHVRAQRRIKSRYVELAEGCDAIWQRGWKALTDCHLSHCRSRVRPPIHNVLYFVPMGGLSLALAGTSQNKVFEIEVKLFQDFLGADW